MQNTLSDKRLSEPDGGDVRQTLPERCANDAPIASWCKLPLVGGGDALISLDDWEGVQDYRWRAVQTSRGSGRAKVYVMATNRGHPYLHRLIMKPTRWEQIDHINGDPLDNRRENLRYVSRHENARNRHPDTFKRGTSQYRGVCWEPRRKRWQASIYANGKQTYIGHYMTEVEAARAYDAASLEHYGRFGTRNFKEIESL